MHDGGSDITGYDVSLTDKRAENWRKLATISSTTYTVGV